ncbi:MAG TPA: flippase-like domain-containing protein [Candidatus Omnitrophica bacterium]|nr:flippase-like domain-containing protein [Candidatus Omnitrophota bacterium]
MAYLLIILIGLSLHFIEVSFTKQLEIISTLSDWDFYLFYAIVREDGPMSKKFLFFAVRAVVSISLIWLLLFNLGRKNLQEFPTYLQNASYSLLAVAVLLFFIGVTFSALRWKKLLEVQDIELKFGGAFSLTFIGFFFSNFLPGVVGGDAVKFYYVARNSHKKSASLASVLLDRILGLSALIIIAFISLLFGLRLSEIQEIVPFVFGLFILLLISLLLFFNLKNFSGLERFFRIKFLNLGERIKRFLDALSLYRGEKRILCLALFLSLIIQTLMVVITYFISLSFHLDISFLYFLLFVPVIILIMSVPISISGIGVREGAFFLLFRTVGVSEIDAVALGLGFYLVTIITSSFGGIIYLLKGEALKKSREV